MKEYRLENTPQVYYIDEEADGDWVVFVHAAFVDHRMFAEQFKYFAGRYKLLAADLLGHGKSTAAKRGEGIANTAFWLFAIMEKHNISRAHFVGVSLGAVIIQDFANKYADRVLSLACFGGYDINNFDPAVQRKNSKGQAGMMLKAMISVKWFAKANKKISAYTPAAQEEFYRLNLSFKKRSFRFLAGLGKLVNKFPPEKKPFRLLVGCGEHDIPAELEIVEKWAAEAGCEKVIFKGAGHCVNLDCPEEFNAYMDKFWSGEQALEKI